MSRDEPILSATSSWRNRLAHRLANAVLKYIADDDYERQIEAFVVYGLRSIVRDHRDNLDPPPSLEELDLRGWRK